MCSCMYTKRCWNTIYFNSTILTFLFDCFGLYLLSPVVFEYRKIPIISAGLILFRKPFLGGLFSGGGGGGGLLSG